MPVINIKVANNSLKDKDKELLITKITDVVSDVLKKDPATTFVLIQEIGTENFGVGGETVAKRIAKGAAL